jgi:hypothetical protein
MARIRTIKPEFFTSSDIVSLTPLSRLFYVSLWCEADREGRLAWTPKTLQYRYLPGDKVKIDALAQELSEAGLIRIYEVDGKQYADIPSFAKHQVINNREPQSTFPAFNGDACVTRESGVKAEGRKEGKERKEGTRDENRFEEFWSAYPKRVAKGQARNFYDQAVTTGTPEDLIISAAKRYSEARAGQDDKFTKHPAAWLNSQSWLDETGAPENKTSDPEDLYWKARVTGYRTRKFWKSDLWGPTPDDPGFRGPRELSIQGGHCHDETNVSFDAKGQNLAVQRKVGAVGAGSQNNDFAPHGEN